MDSVARLTDALGADPEALGRSRRPLARACLDWTERRTHLAGVAGALVCRHLLQQRWIIRVGGGRAVRVTPTGSAALHRLFGVDQAALV